jgi:MtN3 and saliva related transmembrane protein
MYVEQILGSLASFFIVASLIPQLYQIILTRSCEDVSLETYILLIIAQALWVAYGLVKNAIEVFICNLLSLFLSILILSFGSYYKYYKNSKNSKQQNNASTESNEDSTNEVGRADDVI